MKEIELDALESACASYYKEHGDQVHALLLRARENAALNLGEEIKLLTSPQDQVLIFSSLYFLGRMLQEEMQKYPHAINMAIETLHALEKEAFERHYPAGIEEAYFGDRGRDQFRNAKSVITFGKDRNTFAALVEATHDSCAWVRECALKALGEPPSPQPLEPIVEALEDHATLVRHEAIRILLEQFVGDGALIGLASKLKHGNALVRIDVANALGELNDKRAIAPLIDALQEGRHYSPYFIAQALTRLGHAISESELKDYERRSLKKAYLSSYYKDWVCYWD